jgi:hypothetical protein
MQSVKAKFEAANSAKKWLAPFWDIEGGFVKPECACIWHLQKVGQGRQKTLLDRRVSRAKF